MVVPGTSRKRRSQIMLDDDLYERLAEAAQQQKRSVSSLVREAVAQWLDARRPRTIRESPFWSLIGSVDSGETPNPPVSENVDFYVYRLDHDDEPAGDEDQG